MVAQTETYKQECRRGYHQWGVQHPPPPMPPPTPNPSATRTQSWLQKIKCVESLTLVVWHMTPKLYALGVIDVSKKFLNGNTAHQWYCPIGKVSNAVLHASHPRTTDVPHRSQVSWSISNGLCSLWEELIPVWSLSTRQSMIKSLLQPIIFRGHHAIQETRMKPPSLHPPHARTHENTPSFRVLLLTGTSCHETKISNLQLNLFGKPSHLINNNLAMTLQR